MRLKDEMFRLGTGAHRAVLKASGGRLLGRISGMPVVILTTTGRRSGQKRHTTLTAPIYDEKRVVLVASFGGDPRHPAWYLNLRENPAVTLTMEGKDRAMRARTATAEEKAELWPQIARAYAAYDDYTKKTDREIPVVILEPYAGTSPET